MPEDESAGGRPLTSRFSSPQLLLERFHLGLDALRDVVDVYIPLAREREITRLGPAAMSELASLSPSQRQELRELLERLAAVRGTEHEDDRGPRDALAADFAAVAEELFQSDRHSMVAFATRLARGTIGPSRVRLLQNSTLTQAIAAFEALVAGLVAYSFARHPGRLDEDTKHFSIAELRQFASVNDAVESLIDERVLKVMMGSLNDWDNWFSSTEKTPLRSLPGHWDTLEEAFQRRHVIMHNGGLVSRLYLERVKTQDAGLAVGTELEAHDSYLHAVFDQLDVFGTSLAILAWGSWLPDARELTLHALVQRTYELLLLERWSPVESLATLKNLKGPEAGTTALRCNGWIARAEQHGYASIAQEVEAWDTSIAQWRFVLVKHVLLGELDQAADLVAKALASGEIEPGALREWPILKRLREREGFDVETVISQALSSKKSQE